MSITIIRAGLLDTIQDLGRRSYQHLGINPGGAMDPFAAMSANALVGNDFHLPLIEMHFPASKILFKQPCIITITGANFSPAIDGTPIEGQQPYLVSSQAVLTFEKRIHGSWCYIAVWGGYFLQQWLNSYSTNLAAHAGGYQGRKLADEDEIQLNQQLRATAVETKKLPWKYAEESQIKEDIQFIPGPEWDWLSKEQQLQFTSSLFKLTTRQNRMGYLLESVSFITDPAKQLISSAVDMGTVQLLPNGQCMVLMADHQTTGGYPRIAKIIATDLGALSQFSPGDAFSFSETNLATAESSYIKQHQHLQQLQQTCKLKMKKFLDELGH